MPEPSLALAAFLLVAGLSVLLLELFLPTAGLLFAVAMVCVVSSVAVAFWVHPIAGLVFVVVDLALAFVLPGIGLKIWARSPVGRRMFLDAPQTNAAEKKPPASNTSSVDGFDYQDLMGEKGVVITSLRPAGTTDFSGRRVDTVSEGVMIDRGETVRVVAVEGRRVVVRLVEPG